MNSEIDLRMETLGAAPALVLQLVAWVDAKPRTYGEAMDAWRTSCPRLSVWEDALDAGLIEVAPATAGGLHEGRVRITRRGAALLAREAAA